MSTNRQLNFPVTLRPKTMKVTSPQRQLLCHALEFFAGIGLARAGMESTGFRTIWANDNDPNKKEMYENQWGKNSLLLDDIHNFNGSDLPTADLAWSSSPCTDLSLAGKRAGLLDGQESSAFFQFTRLISEMQTRKPKVIILENVVGLASSNNRNDLKIAAKEFNSLGYAVDVITLDARHFIPQSRPRLFLIGALSLPPKKTNQKSCLRPDWLNWLHKDPDIKSFSLSLPPVPEILNSGFTDQIELMPSNDPRWWCSKRVTSFTQSMTMIQKERLDHFVNQSKIVARTAYRRTRNGKPVWEMRAEDIAGCLRTPRGGSSKQAVAIMGLGKLQVRWMTSLEYARLMGADWYNLTNLTNSKIQYGFGDAVAVPVVQWIVEHIVHPLLQG